MSSTPALPDHIEASISSLEASYAAAVDMIDSLTAQLAAATSDARDMAQIVLNVTDPRSTQSRAARNVAQDVRDRWSAPTTDQD